MEHTATSYDASIRRKIKRWKTRWSTEWRNSWKFIFTRFSDYNTNYQTAGNWDKSLGSGNDWRRERANCWVFGSIKNKNKNLYFYVIKSILYCHPEMYSCIRIQVKTNIVVLQCTNASIGYMLERVCVMSTLKAWVSFCPTPKAWGSFCPKTRDEVMTMQEHRAVLAQ